MNMLKMSRKTIRIGDVAEVKTPRGLAFIQYTHDAKDEGSLVRVLPGLHSSRPPDFKALVRERELYFIFYPLQYAVRTKQAEIVSNQPVPDWATIAPAMRHRAGTAPDGRTLTWRIVPALQPLTIEFLQQTPVIRELTPEQRKLSVRELWGHNSMVEELTRGWTPERAELLEEQDREKARAERASQQQISQAPQHNMRHYLYFPRKAEAESAGEQMQNRGFSVEIRKSADGENWLVLATGSTPNTGEEMGALRDSMEALAAQFGGEYDGWEAAIDSSESESLTKGRKPN